MARGPTYTLVVLRQVTLYDVYARVADLKLSVDDFIAAVLEQPSGHRDADFVDAFTWSGLDKADVSVTWKKLGHHALTVAHPNNKLWTGFQKALRRQPERGDAHVLLPVGVRTVATTLKKKGWDGERMPGEAVGGGASLDGLVHELREMLHRSIGGEEYLGSDDVSPARALTVLATTLAAVLLDDAATVSDDRIHARILRADIYEAAVEGAKLGKYFDVIRRLLELHHDEHLRVPTKGRGSEVVDFGFIEYRGRNNQYMKVNVAAAKRWLDPALYR